MRVRMFQMNGDGEQEAGILALRDGQVVAEPSDSRLLKNILAEPIHVLIGEEERMIAADTEPELFLEQLPRAYHGSRLWAGKVER